MQKDYQILTEEIQNLYNCQGMFQQSFIVDKDNNLFCTEMLSPNEQNKIQQQQNISTKISHYVQQLNSREILSSNKIDEMYTFTIEMLNLNNSFTCQDLSFTSKMNFLKFMISFLQYIKALINKQTFLEIANLFFRKEIESSLLYDTDISYEEIDQGKLGLLRSYYLFEQNRINAMNIIKEIKKRKS